MDEGVLSMATIFRVLVSALALSGHNVSRVVLQGEAVTLDELGADVNADSLVEQGFIEPIDDAPVTEPTPSVSAQGYLTLGLKLAEGYVLTDADKAYLRALPDEGVALDTDKLITLSAKQLVDDHVALFDPAYSRGNKSKAAVLVDLAGMVSNYAQELKAALPQDPVTTAPATPAAPVAPTAPAAPETPAAPTEPTAPETPATNG